MEKLIEWLEDRARVSDKLAMIVDHSMKNSHQGVVLRAWYLFDGFYLFLYWRNSAGREDATHVRNWFVHEFAFAKLSKSQATMV